MILFVLCAKSFTYTQKLAILSVDVHVNVSSEAKSHFFILAVLSLDI